MLLTLKQSAHQGLKSFHEYSPPTPPSSSHFSPTLSNAGSSFPPLPPAPKSAAQPMSTPHRGLPPPAAMTLQQPSQGPPPLGQASSLSHPTQLPPAPAQWQGGDESMRNWLLAKAEEEKRFQEEEKTKQEGLRLEQRRIEQNMLQQSLASGIPPPLIPMVFVGMGGGGHLSHTAIELAQNYIMQTTQQAQQHQLQQQQQQHHQQAALPPAHPSPELRREPRQISQFYGGPQHSVPAPLPSTPIGSSSSQQTAGFPPGYPMSPSSRSRPQLPGPGTLSRLPPSELPRLNTGEMHVQQPPHGPSGMQLIAGQPSHPLQQAQSATPSQQDTQSSPNIFFHHWQPPTSQAGSSGTNQPSTPSGKHS
jgi:hypothetical protein